MHPVARTLRAYALFTIFCFAVLAATALVSGYREQAAPQRADFVEAAVAPGGLRLYGVGWQVTSEFAWWWRQCGGGHLEQSVERTGDTVEVDLVFRPSPHLGACPVEGAYAAQYSYGSSLFIPLDGPPPTTVTAEGDDATRHAVIDPDLGPAFPAGTEWESSEALDAPEPAGDGESTRSWTATTGRAQVDVTFATGFVGQAPDVWMQTGDVRRRTGSWRREQPPPLVDAAENIRLAGRPAVARLGWKRGTATIEVSVPDGRVVLRIEAHRMDTAAVLRLVRSIASANP